MIALALFALSISFIAPWGNFPLNDDWVYARNVVASAKAYIAGLNKLMIQRQRQVGAQSRPANEPRITGV